MFSGSFPYICLKKKAFYLWSQGKKQYYLLTTILFDYLIKKLLVNKKAVDKKRLAATAQLYLAKGLFEIIELAQKKQFRNAPVFFAGGLAKNKIISSFLTKKGVVVNQTLPPGDENISFGQIIYYLLTNSWN